MRKDGLVRFEIDLMVNAKLGAKWREKKIVLFMVKLPHIMSFLQ